MAGVPGDLHGQGQDRRFRARVGGSRRVAELPSRDHAERRGPDRLSRPTSSSPCAPTAWRRRRCGGIWRPWSIAASSFGATARTASASPAKGGAGPIEMAFGFELSPLVARAEEFEAWAEDVRAEERALRLVRERITLCRRDIAKMIATGDRGGRADPQGRAGAFGLVRDPRALSRHPGPDSPNGDAGGARADRRRSDAAGRRNPHPVGKSRKIIKFKRQ